MSGKPVKPAAPADRSDHDAGPAPVGHERAAFARPAFKGVMRDRLQDRFLSGVAEGDEGAGECCERSSVPQGYQPETAMHSFRARSAAVAARKPASPRVLLSPLRAGWRRIKAAGDWLDSHWLGDLLGTVCVFGFGFAVLLICWGLQP